MQHTIGKLYVVATPIGNLEDLSFRAQRILSQATWIAAEDTRHSAGLLNAMGIKAPLVAYHEHNEREQSDALIAKLQEGEIGALISDAGTPLISDPGYSLVSKAHAAHIPVIPIPGPCAAITALCASGLPTHRFLFEGFLPAKASHRQKRLQALVKATETLIFYEAPHRIEALLADCVQIFSADRPACLARELTKKFEQIQLSTLGALATAVEAHQIPDKGEFVLIVAGCEETAEIVDDAMAEVERILTILLPEMSVKQAVQIATKLSGATKNTVYDIAIRLRSGN